MNGRLSFQITPDTGQGLLSPIVLVLVPVPVSVPVPLSVNTSLDRISHLALPVRLSVLLEGHVVLECSIALVTLVWSLVRVYQLVRGQ